MICFTEQSGNGFSGKLTYEEALFIVDALNGVFCSPETLMGNLIGWIPYTKINYPSTLENKIRQMSTNQRQELLNKVSKFWSIGTVQDIKSRMIQIGLI